MANDLTWKATIDPAIAVQAMRSIAQEARNSLNQIEADVKKESQAAIALQKQRSAALIAASRDAVRAHDQEFREIQRIHAEKVRMAAQEVAQSTATARRIATEANRTGQQELREIQQIHAQKLRMAQQETAQRLRSEKQAAAEVQRINRETARQAAQQEQIRTRAAKTLADAQIREARRSANEVIASLNRQRTQASSGLSSFAAGAIGGATALIGLSAISEIRNAASAWLDYASKLETTKIAFTTMLGSADLAEQHLKELQQFAIKTPFQFGELIDASQRMQALGFNAQQVIPILTDVGNAVAAAGGGSYRLELVIKALSDVQSKGKLASQEIRQFAESGISAYRILETQLGKSRAELVKMVEAGQISSKVFLDAFQKFSQQNFGGLMEAQAKTFSGAMSNIKDALLQTSATAFEPLYAKLSKLAQEMGNTAISSQKFKDDLKSVGQATSRVFDGAVEAFYLVRDVFRVMAAVVIGQTVAILGWLKALVEVLDAVMHSASAAGRALVLDFAGASREAELAQRSLTQAMLSAVEAGKAQTAVIGVLGQIWTEAGQRALVAGAQMQAASQFTGVGLVVSGTRNPDELETGGSLTGGAGLFRKAVPASAVGSGGKKGRHPKDTFLRDEDREAELNQREALQEINRRVFENKKALDDQLKDIKTFTADAIKLIEDRHDAEIDRFNAEQEALDKALAKKLITQREYHLKDRALALENAAATDKANQEIADLTDKRDKELAAAELSAHMRSVRLADEASERLIRITRDRIDRQQVSEVEGEKQIAEIEAQGYQRKKEALEKEATLYGITLERRKEIADELVLLEGQRADAAVQASQRIIEALENESEARARAMESGGTRPRRVGTSATRERRVGGPTGAIDQIFEGINDKLSGTQQTAAIAGLQALTEAFSGLGQAVGQVVEAWVLYGNAGTSVRKVTAQILAGVAQQAAVKAVFELAEGFAALALSFFGMPNAGPSASAHFAAAAIYGSIAAIAAVSGRAVAGNAFQQASGAGGGSSPSSTSSPVKDDRDRTIREARQGGASDPNEVIGRLAIDLKHADGSMETQMVRIYRSGGRLRGELRNDLLGEANG